MIKLPCCDVVQAAFHVMLLPLTKESKSLFFSNTFWPDRPTEPILSEKNKVNPTGGKNTANLDKLRGIVESERQPWICRKASYNFTTDWTQQYSLRLIQQFLTLPVSWIEVEELKQEGLKLVGQDAYWKRYLLHESKLWLIRNSVPTWKSIVGKE